MTISNAGPAVTGARTFFISPELISNDDFQCWASRYWSKDILYFASMNSKRRFPGLDKPALELAKAPGAVMRKKRWRPGSAGINLRTPGRRVLTRGAPGNSKHHMFCDGCSATPSSRRIWRGSAGDRGGGRIRIARRRVPQSIANTNIFGTVCVSGCCGAF